MREVDRVCYAIAVVFDRINTDEFAALAHFQLFADAHVAALAALLLESYALHHVHEWLRATIKDGELKVVELDDRVINAGADECGEKMFGGRDENALLHQAGGVAHARNISTGGFDLKIVEINAAKDDTRSRGRGQHAHFHSSAAVQADAFASDFCPDCLLVNQAFPPNLLS